MAFWKFRRKRPEEVVNKEEDKKKEPKKVVIPPGRISVPTDNNNILRAFGGRELVTPSFRTELIPLIRDLYKVNPDVGIAVSDMFKLANTGFTIKFPNNTDAEATKMREHLLKVSKKWSNYTAGVYGLTNKMIVQLLVSGALSIEAVPNQDLNGVATLVFVNPDDIVFEREGNGVYHPYQKNHSFSYIKDPYIKLNLATYKYSSMFNDTDEPYGVPPFMTALDSLKNQENMKGNFFHIMELMGMFGFLEAKIQKDFKKPNESENAYAARLKNNLTQLKHNLADSLKDGVVVGYMDDHEFKLNSTTQNLANVDKVWNMNEQSVANGLGVNGNIIGVTNVTSEGGTSMLISKMISQLKNVHMLLSDMWSFIFELELLLAGYNSKGVEVEFKTSTITDEVKYQQSQEYKIRNLTALYNQGIISQEEFAFTMGYARPAESEPRITNDDINDIDDSAAKKARKDDKNKSDRKTREKNNPNPKRKDGDTKER